MEYVLNEPLGTKDRQIDLMRLSGQMSDVDEVCRLTMTCRPRSTGYLWK
jgi:hypothetical protein